MTYPNRSPRRRLSDILDGRADQLRRQWETTEAAGEFSPLPPGTYVAHANAGELFTAKSGTAGYKLTFKLIEGEHAGRYVWHDLWLTAAALPMTKRDLGKLGIASLEQLEGPLPQGIRCKLRVTLRRNDDGTEYNAVRSFECIGIDTPEPDAFAPDDAAGGNGEGSAPSGDTEGDTSFDPMQLEAAGQVQRGEYDPERDG